MHILLVEDNVGDVRLVREAIEESKVDSSLAAVSDGEEALDYLSQQNARESEARPDVILLDLNMPKMTGETLLEEIKSDSALSAVPVIVLTSSGQEEKIYETYELGADGYFIKPPDPDVFIANLRTIWESVASSGQIPLGEFSEMDQPD